MEEDYLKDLDPPAVAAFYRRLASFIQQMIGGDGQSLASMLLIHWLDGKGQRKIYPSKYVSNLRGVRIYLRETARPIFLSQRPPPKQQQIGGIVPRIKGTIPTNDPPGGPYKMRLEGGVETPVSIQARAAMGLDVDRNELDAFFALHNFGLNSDVVVSAANSGRGYYNVKFDRWTCKAVDEYHWNKDKHIEVPNPDFGSTTPGSVAPTKKKITVYHSNAIRVEQANLAQSFNNESEPWDVYDVAITGPATVNI